MYKLTLYKPALYKPTLYKPTLYKPTFGFGLVLASALFLFSPVVAADALLKERGDRFSVSASLGPVISRVKVDDPAVSDEVSFERGGNILWGRIGYAVSPMLSVDAGYGVWRRSPEIVGEENEAAEGDAVDRYSGNFLVAANIYPLGRGPLKGLFLRAGIGVGKASAVRDSVGFDGMGWSAAMGVGYEIWAGDDLSLLLQAEYLQVAGGDVDAGLLMFTLGAALHRSREELLH